jgi:non-heme chloroperoxidase
MYQILAANDNSMSFKGNPCRAGRADLCFIKINTMPFIKTNDGTTLFYKDWGTGKPVVFIHGAGMNSTFWEYNMVALNSKGLRCIAYDRRSHGLSDDPGTGYDFDTLTDDLHSLLAQLDLRDVTLVAHSMGGGEIIRYQARYAKAGRVSKVVLIGVPDYLRKAADNPEGIDSELFEQNLATTLGKDFPQWLNDNVDPFYLPETFGISEGMKSWTIEMMRQMPLRAVLCCQRLTFETDLREEARQIRIPTLVIHGDKDVSIPFRCGQSFSKLIPGCLFKAYQGAPHGVTITHAEQVNHDLHSFING